MRKEAHVEREGERDRGARELGGNHRNYTAAAAAAALKGEERREERKAGGRQAGRGELTWHDGTESDSRPHLLPQMEQWRIRCITETALPSQPMSNGAGGITLTSNVNRGTD